MGIFGRLFRRNEPPSERPAQETVLVFFAYGSTDLDRLFELEERLEAAIAAAEVGTYDGNEIAVDGSDATLFMYGPDADTLLAVVRPILEAAEVTKGATVRLLYGPSGNETREQEITLGG